MFTLEKTETYCTSPPLVTESLLSGFFKLSAAQIEKNSFKTVFRSRNLVCSGSTAKKTKAGIRTIQSVDGLTKVAGAVVAVECSSSLTFLLTQRNRVLQSCTQKHTHFSL